MAWGQHNFFYIFHVASCQGVFGTRPFLFYHLGLLKVSSSVEEKRTMQVTVTPDTDKKEGRADSRAVDTKRSPCIPASLHKWTQSTTGMADCQHSQRIKI